MRPLFVMYCGGQKVSKLPHKSLFSISLDKITRTPPVCFRLLFIYLSYKFGTSSIKEFYFMDRIYLLKYIFNEKLEDFESVQT